MPAVVQIFERLPSFVDIFAQLVCADVSKDKDDLCKGSLKVFLPLLSIIVIISVVVLHHTIKHFTHVWLEMVSRIFHECAQEALTPSR